MGRSMVVMVVVPAAVEMRGESDERVVVVLEGAVLLDGQKVGDGLIQLPVDGAERSRFSLLAFTIIVILAKSLVSRWISVKSSGGVPIRYKVSRGWRAIGAAETVSVCPSAVVLDAAKAGGL